MKALWLTLSPTCCIATAGGSIIIIDDTIIYFFMHLVDYSRPFATTLLPLRLPPLQVDFNRRKEGDISNDCLMSINGTDFQIPQTRAAVRGNAFASHKDAFKSALRYEMASPSCGGTWFGSRARTPPVTGRMSRSSRRSCATGSSLASASKPTTATSAALTR